MASGARSATYAIVDVETTGVDASRDRVVEVACVVVRDGVEQFAFSTLVDPGIPIPAYATAIHGITDDDVAYRPALEAVAPLLERLCADAIVVAHNAAFDMRFLPMLADRPRLCTLRLARRLFPDLHSHANQSLRTALGVRVRDEGAPAHRALSDARVTAGILDILLRRYEYVGLETTVDAVLAFARRRIRRRRRPRVDVSGQAA